MLDGGKVIVTAQGNVGVPVERLRALVNLLYPEEMTPTARRMIEQVIKECELAR